MIITPLTWLLICAAFLAGLASPTLLCALQTLGHRCACLLRRAELSVESGLAILLYGVFGAVQNRLHHLDPFTFAPVPVDPALFLLTLAKQGRSAKRSRPAPGSTRQRHLASLGHAYGRFLYHARFSIVGLWLVLAVAAMPLVVRLPGELSTSSGTEPGSQFDQTSVGTQLPQLATHMLVAMQSVLTVQGVWEAALIALSASLLFLLSCESVAAASVALLLVALAIGTALAMLSLVALTIQVNLAMSSLVVILSLTLAVVFSVILVRRFRRELKRQTTVAEAAVASLATTGAAIFFSGLVVLIGCAGLLFLGDTGLRRVAIGGIVSISITVGAALTLLPAFLAILGQRVNVLPVMLARAFRLLLQGRVPRHTNTWGHDDRSGVALPAG
jgi:hypothetical protein